MSREEDIFNLLVESNPVPDIEDSDLLDAGAPEYLAILERRSSGMADMSSQAETTPTDGRRGYWLAVAALAVIVIGVAVIVASQRGDGADPVTDGIPTADQVADTFVSGLVALDPLPVDGLVSTDAAATYLGTFGYDETQPGSIRALWEWGATYGMAYTFEEGCRATDNTGGPPASDGRAFFSCDYVLENDWTRAMGQQPMPGRFRMEVSDGRIVWLVEDFPFDDFEHAWGAVIAWVESNHPEDFDTMFLDPPGSASLTSESIALWTEYTPQILESLSG